MTTAMATVTSSSDVLGGLDQEVSSRALQDFGITNREPEVLQGMADGMGDKQIAACLAVSTFTIPDTNPCSEAAMPRRVGKRSSVISVIDGMIIAKPMP